MAEKALVTGVEYVVHQDSGQYEFIVNAQLTVGNARVEIVTTILTNVFLPPSIPAWRTTIKNAVIANALGLLGVVVDEVMFPDFGN